MEITISVIISGLVVYIFMSNLAKKKDLHEASNKLKKTKWYDNLLTEDFKKLVIKKHKKLL